METMKKAVIVEDFKLIADIWRTVLMEEGFEEIVIVRHADEVVDKVVSFSPDIILMDINLPGSKNGLELAEELLKLDKTYKIMILTIHTEPSYIQKAMSIGAMGYVTKNSSIVELKTAINSILDGKTYLCNEISNQN